jgi:hypothetical protein
MSNALAIGAVTAVIQSLLENGLARQGIANSLSEIPAVTVLPPDPESPASGGQSADRLNLFLYQTAPNASWRNVGLPSHNGNGDRTSNPPLALNLYYLLTAYSKEPFHAEIMLGYAMQLLHETPILTRGLIRTTLRNLASRAEPVFRSLATSSLADQVELVKLSPQLMSTDEMSKLWSAIQTQYRPTVVYQASVVLIESQQSTQSALPVRERRLHVLPFSQPTIATVKPQIVTQGSQLTIEGSNLRGNSPNGDSLASPVSVNFGFVTISPDTQSDQQVQVTVPDNLPAGINTVQILQLLDFGVDSGLHRGFESNIIPFMLRPQIARIEAPDGIREGQVNVIVRVDPVIRQTQRVTLLLNEQGGSAAAYSATASPRDTDANPIAFTLNGIKAGRYLARVRVDGAESVLRTDNDPNSPTFNQYMEPVVAIACSSDCLRCADITLTSTRTEHGLAVEARVSVNNEVGTTIPGVTVTVVWTLPDGTTRNDTKTTDSNGVERGIATFTISGSPGTYTLSVTNLSKSGFCFDAPQSAVLNRSIAG